MREELDKQLVEKYPLLYRDRHAPMTETAMCWGFCCGEGWYNIIDTLSALLCSEYNQAKERYQKKDMKVSKNIMIPTKNGLGLVVKKLHQKKLKKND